jgi:hypothetical protein
LATFEFSQKISTPQNAHYSSLCPNSCAEPYFSFPQAFYAPSSLVDPADKYTDAILFGLSQLHFGRFGWYTKALWAVLGLVPAFLAFTGVFVCCHRMIYHRSFSPNSQ